MGRRTTRREFLKQMAVTGAVVSGLPLVASATDKATASASGKSRVVVATDISVLKGEDTISQSVLENMLGKSVATLTDSSTPALGWKALFTPEDVVGIKVNCLFGRGVATRPELVEAVVRGLRSAGVKENNIIIWDRSTSDLIKVGFKPNKDGAGVKCYGDDGHWGELIEQGKFKGHISTIISNKVTAIVNVPILKTHGISGMSCCLKNHYGSFDNPGSHHDNHCNPALADFSSIPVVKQKTRLVVADAIRPQYDGGPGLQPDAQFNSYSLIVSKDPVAADSVGLDIINKKRISKGIGKLPEVKVAWLQSAQDRGVGVCDPEKIELLRV